MEASALQAPVGLTRQRSVIGMSVLRLRSDEQLVALVRSGHDEAFQVIHDRYRQRLFAYVRQMLRSRQDAEDALQDVFERAYWSLSGGGRGRELALRPWLYRIAHNRCIDHLRRPIPPPPEAMFQLGPPVSDPMLEADRRETVRRLMVDVSRLPPQQRSALLMRELGGISYADVAQALGVTVPAVKSLLVRARVSLVEASEARDAACVDIRAELLSAHEGGVRPNAMARRHLRDCPGCRQFRGDLRGVRRQLLAVSPSTGPLGLLAKLVGGGSGSGGGAAAAWSASAASGAAGGGGVLAAAGSVAGGVTHVATIVAATVATAGGAAALQHTVATQPAAHHGHRPAVVARHKPPPAPRPAAPAAPRPTARTAAPSPQSPPSPAAVVAAAPIEPAPVHRVHHPVAPSNDQLLAPAPDQPAPSSDRADPSNAGLTGPAGPSMFPPVAADGDGSSASPSPNGNSVPPSGAPASGEPAGSAGGTSTGSASRSGGSTTLTTNNPARMSTPGSTSPSPATGSGTGSS